jgi:hypothetical protein
VSVLTSAKTDCHGRDASDHWYSFEYSAKGGPGPAWISVLLSAKVAGQRVVIHGAGTCNASGMEEVASIDLPGPVRFPATPIPSPAKPAAPGVALRNGWPPALQMLDAFDRAAHLEPLSNGTGPQLRIWMVPSMGETVAYIISHDRVFACSASFRNNGGAASVGQANCEVSYLPAVERRRALSLLPALSDLNGKTWGCATLGGETYYVEGFTNPGRFAFIVSNPDQCPGSSSVTVKRLVNMLRF